MTLHFRIFHPVKRKGRNLTFSEKLSYWSLGVSLFIGLFCLALEKTLLIKTNDFLVVLLLLGFLGHFLSFIIRIGEHENVNGYFDGNIIFKDEYLEIKNQHYLYNKISNLKFSISDYYGKPTNNYRYGPMYKNGISNYISFTIDGEDKFFNFELNSEFLIDKLYYHLIDIICLEKTNYQRSYLDLIPNDFRGYSVFKSFIIKLIQEKKLECREGLLIHGYDSDQEAKELREKYCN